MLGYMLPFLPYPYRGVMVDCPVCGAQDHQQIARTDRKAKRLSTHMCRHCGLFFTNPMPTEAELTQYYETTYRAEYQFARFRPRRSHVDRKQREAVARGQQLATQTDLSLPRRFLDFGTGSGELPRHMAELGHAAIGFEPGETYVGYAQSQTPAEGACSILTGRWQDMSFEPGSFDVITCLHVLEHLATPIEALTRLREWLAPGGVLLLEVPNMPGYNPKGPTRFHFAHVLGFSRENLLLAAERAGLGIVAERTPTSLFLTHLEDPRVVSAEVDLAAAVARNAAEYGQRPAFATRVRYHLGRTWRVLSRELGLRKG